MCRDPRFHKHPRSRAKRKEKLGFAINLAGVDQIWLVLNSSDCEPHNLGGALNTTDWSTSECLKVKRRKQSVRLQVMSSEGTLQRSTHRFIATYLRARVDIHTRGFKQSPHQTPQLVNKYGYASFTDSSNLKYYPQHNFTTHINILQRTVFYRIES